MAGRLLSRPASIGFHRNADMPALLRSGDLLVHPSIADLESVSVIEGMAAGLVPVIASSSLSAAGQFALLAKGWLLGLQFDTLFTDGLYLRIARHANDAADRIRKVLVERGYTLTFDAPTNQIFVTLDNETSERLQRDVRLGFTEKADDTHTVMRICTSWATTDKQVDELVALL